MLDMADYGKVMAFKKQGRNVSEIAREVGCSRTLPSMIIWEGNSPFTKRKVNPENLTRINTTSQVNWKKASTTPPSGSCGK